MSPRKPATPAADHQFEDGQERTAARPPGECAAAVTERPDRPSSLGVARGEVVELDSTSSGLVARCASPQGSFLHSARMKGARARVCRGSARRATLSHAAGVPGVSFCQGYGLTETAPFASLLSSDLAMVKVGSAGKAPMFTEVQIVDGDNNPVAAGVHGEVCIKGPNVMKGYWNRPEATAEAIDKLGWFHSGDIGYLDDEDFLFLCDRVKDMVISGGENVYPAEVESVLYGHPAIVEVAVIGLPDDKWGEAVTAIVVLEEGSTLDLEELRAFSGESLARYKQPSQLRFVDILPRNPAGKVQKFKLKEQFDS